MNVAVCPSSQELASFLVGELPEARAAEVESHVDGCQACQQAVISHESRPDWLVQALPAATHEVRSAADRTVLEGDSNWRSVLSRVQALRSGVGDPQALPVPAGEPEALGTIRDYRLLSKLGEGGMGAVYLARHEKLGRDVALKLMHPQLTHRAHIVSRFEREMKAVGKLDHPAIVRATDAGIWEDRHYLAMEFVPGVALNELVKERGPLPIADACEIVRQAAEALHYAHERGLVHRDVKPANIMLTNLGGIKLLDMGLALLNESEDGPPELTSAGQFMGTLDYMAPEQASNSHTVDRRADIYSLGATLYKLLSGEVPIGMARQPSLLSCLTALTSSEPTPLRDRRSEVPPQLSQVIHRMLRKSPEDRYASLAEVAERLAPFAEGSDLARLANPSLPATPFVSSKSRATAAERKLVERKPAGVAGLPPLVRSRVGWIAGGLAAAVVVLLGVVLALQTTKGLIVVELPDDVDAKEISISVKRGGEEVEVVDASKGWKIRLADGGYDVDFKSGGDKFELTKDSVSVSRLTRTILRVTLKPVEVAAKKEPAATKQPIGVATTVPASSGRRPVAPRPEKVLPNREKPFVILAADGKVRGEYAFAAEPLALLQDQETLEVHGNGPFKIPAIVRDRKSLFIKAGAGYRPQFNPDMVDSKAEHLGWFDIQDADLSLEGCDFRGIRAHSFSFFRGTGRQWSIKSCRLIQPPTILGGTLVAFTGDKLTICDSLLSVSSLELIRLAAVRQVELTNNIVAKGPAIFSLHSPDGQAIELTSNVLFDVNGVIDLRPSDTKSKPVKIMARDNLLSPTYSSLVTLGAPEFKQQMEWIGTNNVLSRRRAGSLWSLSVEQNNSKLSQTVDEWNAFWGRSEDLIQQDRPPVGWDYFAAPNWLDGLAALGDELEAVRQRKPSLKQIGPDLMLVGSGQAFERARKSDAANEKLRPASLEGGPFVVLRNGKAWRGFVSLQAAMSLVQAGDVIEICSDGPFGLVEATAPEAARLTLRPAPGYHPAFEALLLGNSGDWTVEGLHFLGHKTQASLVCAARRVANCSFADSPIDPLIELHRPAAAKEPIEVEYCYVPGTLYMNGPDCRIFNCALNAILIYRAEPTTLKLSRTVVWSHRVQAFRPSIMNRGKVLTVTTHDCLFDTPLILNGDANWQGDRNDYRLQGGHGTFGHIFRDGNNLDLTFDLAAWQALWKSDAQSESEDSALLSPESWPPRSPVKAPASK